MPNYSARWSTYITCTPNNTTQKTINGYEVIEVEDEGRILQHRVTTGDEAYKMWLENMRIGNQTKINVYVYHKNGKKYYKFYPNYF